MIGARVTEARKKLGMKQVELLAKLQTEGVDISILRSFASGAKTHNIE